MSPDTCCPTSEADGLVILVLILIAGLVYWWISNWMTGAAKASSGHTIKVGKKEVPVRLHAVNSLQPPVNDRAGQPWTDASGVTHDGGVIAKGRLAEQLAGKKVKVRLGLQEEPDPYGRVVGQVFVDCEDVGLWMVANGYAFAAKPDPRFDERLRQRYAKAEVKAKKRRLGFHAGKHEDPQDWIRKQPAEHQQELDP